MNLRHTGIWKAASVLMMLTMLVLIGLPSAPGQVIFAANTGWRNPTADLADTGGNDDGFDKNPENAYVDGTNFAYSRSTCVTAPCTERHRFYNYNLVVPTDAVVQGIEVRADWWVDFEAGVNMLGVELSWDGGTTWTNLRNDAPDPEPTVEGHTVYFGADDDTWGRAWVPSDFSNANFRVRVNITTDITDRRFYLDWISVRVTYNQLPFAPTNQTPAVGAFTGAANPTFAWSPFDDPNTADTQIAFQVQLRTQAGTYGGAGSRDSGTIASPASTYTPGSWNLSAGAYCWHVRVQDNSGVTTYSWSPYSSETCFNVDRDAPASAATAPSYDNGGTIPVAWTASDVAGGAGLSTVALWFKLDAGAWTDSGMSQSGTAGTFDFSPPGDTNGIYYFQTIATDLVGNVEAGPAGDGDDSTAYDTTPPTSQAAPPAGPISTGPLDIPWTADGAVSGIAAGGVLLRYNYNGGAFADGPTASGTSGTLHFVPLDGFGTYCFYTIATDNAGNVEAAPASPDGCTISNVPGAVDDSYTTPQSTPLAVPAPGVLANDVDALAAVLVSGPASGTFDLDDDGSFLYVPAPGFTGQVTFTYRATNGTATSNIATVTITVTPATGAPVAVDDSYSTVEDTPLAVAAPGVLANDVNALTAALVAGPASGTLDLEADGSFLYTPAAGFSGQVSFTYQASNGTGTSNIATVTITVTPVNDAPVAVDDSYSTAEDTPLSVSAPGVLANDTDSEDDPLTAALVSGPASGTLDLEADGSFVYTPAANFAGDVTFTYQASDGMATSNIATVTITVTPVNDVPVAANDSYSTLQGTPLTVHVPGVLANDSDPDGDPLTATLVSGPASGTVVLQSNGSFVYTPASGFRGQVTFTYRASDGTATSNVATVTITVNAEEGHDLYLPVVLRNY